METTTHNLYNNTIEILHNPKGRPRYKIKGKKVHPMSVSQIAQTTDKSAILMPWQLKIIKNYLNDYITALEKETITKPEIIELAEKAVSEPDRIKNDSGTLGTAVHDWLSEFALSKIEGKKEIPELPEDVRGQRCISGFLQWYNKQKKKVKFVETESVIYSKRYNYVGRLDTIAYVDKTLMLWDYKTSNGLYPSCLTQIVGYIEAKNEEWKAIGDPRRITKGLLFHLDKKTWEFKEPIVIENIPELAKAFRYALRLSIAEKKMIKQLK